MAKRKTMGIHLAILVIGTFIYLFCVFEVTYSNAALNMNLALFYRCSVFYMVFVVLLFGQALLWHLPLVLSEDDEPEKKPEVNDSGEV